MLTRVAIRNFRSCQSTSFEADRTVLALCGKNGAGKTTVLKAIEWWATSVIAVSPIDLRPTGNPDSFDRYIAIEVDLTLGETSYHHELKVPAAYHRNSMSLKVHSTGLGVGESLWSNEQSERTLLFHRSGDAIDLPGREDPIRISPLTPAIAALLSLLPMDDPRQRAIGIITDFATRVQYYPFDEEVDTNHEDLARHLDGDSYRNWASQARAEQSVSGSINLRMIFMWVNEREKFDELLSIVGPDGLGLVAEIAIEHIQFHDASPRKHESKIIDFYQIDYIPGTTMGGAGIGLSLDELSLGTRRVLRIITCLLFDKRSLMLIEQPEDSIHPGLLRKLIEVLRLYAGENQVIFTTHSPSVMDVLDPEEVLLVTAEDGATQVRNLSAAEIEHARWFLDEEGSMSEFIETLERS